MFMSAQLLLLLFGFLSLFKEMSTEPQKDLECPKCTKKDTDVYWTILKECLSICQGYQELRGNYEVIAKCHVCKKDMFKTNGTATLKCLTRKTNYDENPDACQKFQKEVMLSCSEFAATSGAKIIGGVSQDSLFS